MYWALLFVAILLEIAGTVCTKLADGFSRLLPSIGIMVFYLLSLALLAGAVINSLRFELHEHLPADHVGDHTI